jgi:hypothetical protein
MRRPQKGARMACILLLNIYLSYPWICGIVAMDGKVFYLSSGISVTIKTKCPFFAGKTRIVISKQ